MFDLVDLIYEYATTLQDVIRLALTSRHLWNMGRPHIERRLNEAFQLSLWAGNRILCTNEMIMPGELPAGFLTNEEKREKGYFGYAFTEIKQRDQDLTATQIYPLLSHIHYRDYATLMGLVHIDEQRSSVKKTPSILRNLSVREFVRSSAVKEMQEHASNRDTKCGQRLKDVGFGEIATLRTFLGPALDGSNGSTGIWAAHFLDIVTVETFEEDAKKQGADWKDVSQQAIKEIISVWVAEFGIQLTVLPACNTDIVAGDY